MLTSLPVLPISRGGGKGEYMWPKRLLRVRVSHCYRQSMVYSDDRKKTRVIVFSDSVLSAWGHMYFSASQQGAILPPGDAGECLGTFLVITMGRCCWYLLV